MLTVNSSRCAEELLGSVEWVDEPEALVPADARGGLGTLLGDHGQLRIELRQVRADDRLSALVGLGDG